MSDTVALSLPVRSELLVLARITAATMAARADFDIEEIEDLGLLLGVDPPHHVGHRPLTNCACRWWEERGQGQFGSSSPWTRPPSPSPVSSIGAVSRTTVTSPGSPMTCPSG